MNCYVVFRNRTSWIVEFERRVVGRYSDGVHAMDAAIDLAQGDGEAGRPAKVVERNDAALRTVWMYGRDPYPNTPGYPAGRVRGTYRMP